MAPATNHDICKKETKSVKMKIEKMNKFILVRHTMVKFTKDEYQEILNYVFIITGETKSSSGKFKRKYGKVLMGLTNLIESYGDDGYGDKPEGLSRVAYWLQHLDVEKL